MHSHSLRATSVHWYNHPVKTLLTAPAAVAAAVLLAPAAHADKTDFIVDLALKGVAFHDVEAVTRIGASVCALMRQGAPITVEQANGGRSIGDVIHDMGGYDPNDASIITLLSAKDMCPQQLPRVYAAASGAPDPGLHGKLV